MSKPAAYRRLPPEQRKALIVSGVLNLSKKRGLYGWSQREAAAACSVKTSVETLKNYFPTVDALRLAVCASEFCTPDLRKQAQDSGLLQSPTGVIDHGKT